MALIRRRLAAPAVGDLHTIGAVLDDDGVLAGFRPEVPPDAIRRAIGDAPARLTAERGSLLVRFGGGAFAEGATPAEPGHLDGRNVLLALRDVETPDATADWLTWHAREAGADAALIFDRGRPGRDQGLGETLTKVAGEMTVLLVAGEAPTGPAGPDPWAGAFDAFALLELLRRAYCTRARAVAFATIADLLQPGGAGTVFDRAAARPGEALTLTGTEVFPWRLRKKRPAPHGDHIMARGVEKWHHRIWCVAPAGCPDGALWYPGAILGMRQRPDEGPGFRRAMGVARPGVPVARLVRKTDLLRDDALAGRLLEAFGRSAPEAPAVLHASRQPAADRRRVTVVTAMKNEGPFILDWIAHHRIVGVDRFLVYTNDCQDGTDRLLDLLSESSVIRRENTYQKTGKVPQYAAFRAAGDEDAVRGADWLVTLDVDEYLNIRAGGGRLSDLFDTAPEAGAVSMPWRLFGNGDLHHFEDRPVVHQFDLCAPACAPRPLQAWAFKTLYRNDGTFARLGVHRPRGFDAALARDLVWLDGSGRPFPKTLWRGGWRMTMDTWGYDLAGINHYAVRSAESFLVKRDRGRVNHVGLDQGLAYWFRMNHNVESDRSLRRLDKAVAEERARLAALPGVAEAHEASVGWHRARIADLKRDPDHGALFAEITGRRMEKLSRLTPNFGYEVFYAGPESVPDAIVARNPGDRFHFNI